MKDEITPNVLFIIGNGFDLAHEMRTSYYDFLLWYLNEANASAIKKMPFVYDDNLIAFENKFPTGYEAFKSIDGFENVLRNKWIHIDYKNELFQKLVESYSDSKWVDIEYTYYQRLLFYYKMFEKHGGQYDTQVKRINECLTEITNYLVKYLRTIKFPGVNQKIQNTLWGAINYEGFKNACFLVFNYTDTVEYYLSHLELNKDAVINIHGQLNNSGNPIIFGYGDEMDSYYSKMEDLNDNEYLRHMKSFGYFKTSNYQELLRFIGGDNFKICIMGHSCGLSDRVLLNTLFCHENCKRIQIFYHDKGQGQTDYVHKTMEISRHFKPEDKAKMREKIVCLKKSQPLS